jgi:hypothetical protein
MNEKLNPLDTVKTAEAKLTYEIARTRGVFQRFPLVFTLLGAFGLVATFYGFEHIIDQIDFLANNPFLLLVLGIGTLVFTGQLYKKLG